MKRKTSSLRIYLLSVLSILLASSPRLAQSIGVNGWAEVDALIKEQKFDAALEKTKKVLSSARQGKDSRLWTEALVRAVQLQTGLHGYELAARYLKEEAWPQDDDGRVLLHLLYAQSLENYHSAYSWEISRREQTISTQKVDLKAWTRLQIGEEMSRSLSAAFKSNRALEGHAPDYYAPFLRKNNYPAGVRPTLRDAVVYVAANYLAQTTFWRPEELNELYKLNFTQLVGNSKNLAAPDLSNSKIHPLERLSGLLAGHAEYHLKAGRTEGALEARYELARLLHAVTTDIDDQAKVTRYLADFQNGQVRPGSIPDDIRRVNWWASGQALLAGFLREGNKPGRQIEARNVALAGQKAFPGSVAGDFCREVVEQIEAPSFTITSMRNDGPQRRSILVNYANINKLYFRAYAVDFEKRARETSGNHFFPRGEEILKLIDSSAPSLASWNVDLPAIKDFATHRRFVVPPFEKSGAYIIVASLRADFERNQNAMYSTSLILSDLVLSRRNTDNVQVEAHVRHGVTGRPVAGAEVILWKYNWSKPGERDQTQKTDGDGYARLLKTVDPKLGYSDYYLLMAKLGQSFVFDPSTVWFGEVVTNEKVRSGFVFTDRSVYRPGQKIFWKTLVYQGSPTDGQFEVAKGVRAEAILYDINNQVVAKQGVTSNSFGTASGEFAIPNGRPLGNWRIELKMIEMGRMKQAYASPVWLKVEEYKRPTFEVAFLAPSESFRLNRKANLKGEARYYFGLPVSAGRVHWRVRRTPVFPWWWEFGYGRFRKSGGTEQTIASGSSIVQSDGKFSIDFLPEADERENVRTPGITYQFLLEADVTDEGGETRSASRSVRLGFVSIEARVPWKFNFFREKQHIKMDVLRSDLEGTGRAGTGTFRIARLLQPKETPLPVDFARNDVGESGPYEVPDDRLRGRWETDWSWEAVTNTWKEETEVSTGRLQHNAKGEAQIVVPHGFSEGAYRLSYESKDDFGSLYKFSRDFIVAGSKSRLSLPLILLAEQTVLKVGETARFFIHSGLSDAVVTFEIYRAGKLLSRIKKQPSDVVEIPVTEADRGGFSVQATVVRDYQLMVANQSVSVPWDNKELKLQFSTFRDKILPGTTETFRVMVQDTNSKGIRAGTAEVLAYMYDRSLDLFGPHSPASPMGLYPSRSGVPALMSSQGTDSSQAIIWNLRTPFTALRPFADALLFFDNYGIGGLGRRRGDVLMKGGVPMSLSVAAEGMLSEADEEVRRENSAAPKPKDNSQSRTKTPSKGKSDEREPPAASSSSSTAASSVSVRTDFSETAFWQPHLVNGANGEVGIEFKVPDSLTSWKFWVHAITQDLRSGSISQETQSVKELMVRPYLPRFLREGDSVEIKVAVSNASSKQMKGELQFDLHDPETQKSVTLDFGLRPGELKRAFDVASDGTSTITFKLKTPQRVGVIAVKVIAHARHTSLTSSTNSSGTSSGISTGNEYSDGERRILPILPSRMHLTQSRFVTLKNQSTKTLEFKEMAENRDTSLIHDRLVVTVEGQLFQGVLQALPYLISYPYECVEQTLNRFVSTGMVTSLFHKYPALKKMSFEYSNRKTRLERFDAPDANRRMSLEESPWLQEAQGGQDTGLPLINVLDNRVARLERDAALTKLQKMQLPSGAFPWFPGGPPDEYMTLYVLMGLARATEYNIEIPKDLVIKSWRYMKSWVDREIPRMMANKCCWEMITLLNYALTNYKDLSWTGNQFSEKDRRKFLDYSFSFWKDHSPLLKGLLALTLKRSGRLTDARLVWESVMDSAKTDEERGTYWAPEDRSWLWYNDTIETQAMALRVLMEMGSDMSEKTNVQATQPPKANNGGRASAEQQAEGLVQWLFLNKKLNHWKSTRATAEVIDALVRYLENIKALGIEEIVDVQIGSQKEQMTFKPETVASRKNQIVIAGEKVKPQAMSKITVQKSTPGFAFASVAWHFSTEKLPTAGDSDFFSVTRRYFKRELKGREWTLTPLAEGAKIGVGDQIEVQLSLQTKHEAEYVHLRDPRAAGLEPETQASGYKWDLGLSWYEEVRDSGTNFFFGRLPVGEYTFKYRLRAATAGVFRVSPATVQSMYAPEFNAYSGGQAFTIAP